MNWYYRVGLLSLGNHERIREYYKPIWLGGTKLANRLLKFFAFAYLARVLGLDTFGVFSFAFRFMLPFASLADFGLELTAIKSLSRHPEMQGEIVKKFAQTRVLAGGVAYFFMGVCLLFWPNTEDFRGAVLLFGIMLFFSEVTFSWPFFATGEYQEVGVGNLLDGVVLLVGIWLFVQDSSDLYIAILIMGIAAVTDVGYLVFRYLRKYGKRKIIRHVTHAMTPIINVRQIIKESFPLAASGVLFRFYSNAIPLLLGFLLTTQAIGLFNVAIQIPQLFITLAQIFSNALILPLASKAYREVSVNGIIFDQVPSWRKLKHRFEMLVLAVLLLMAFIIPFSLTFSDSFITFLYGAEYEAAGAIFTILFASTLIGLLGIGYRSLLPAFDRQGAYFKITLIQSAFVLITGWFAIKYFGVVGGAYSILIGELFALFSVIFYLRAIGLAFSLRYDLASLGFHLVSSRNYPIKKSRVEK